MLRDHFFEFVSDSFENEVDKSMDNWLTSWICIQPIESTQKPHTRKESGDDWYNHTAHLFFQSPTIDQSCRRENTEQSSKTTVESVLRQTHTVAFDDPFFNSTVGQLASDDTAEQETYAGWKIK